MKKFLKQPTFILCSVAITLSVFYWGVYSTDRYVSEANVVLESPQISASSINFSSLLNGTGSRGGDMLLLRDYLLSVDVLVILDRALDLRNHYADERIDFISALASPVEPLEEFHEYYLKRVHVELDDYANVLRIQVEAFDSETAHRMASLLLEEGEGYMNALGRRLAQEQVQFLEAQVDDLSSRYNDAREELTDYQNQNGLVSPDVALQNLTQVVGGLEADLARMKAKRRALLPFKSGDSTEIVTLDSEIASISEQISLERSRMAEQSGTALNMLSSEYQSLELKLKFAQDSYAGALAALENTRIEAARKLKQVSVLQNPTLPEYPKQPQRLYSIAVSVTLILLLGLIGQMLVMIIREHKD